VAEKYAKMNKGLLFSSVKKDASAVEYVWLAIRLTPVTSQDKKTGTNWLPFFFNPETGLHVLDDRVAKF
jgi:hypothetical protein